jgi:thiamine-monophosphate kinase
VQLTPPLAEKFDGALKLQDDFAIVPKDSKTDYIISKDALVENVHFFKDSMAESIAHRILISNLSDIASSGATPKFYLLAGSVNNKTDQKWLEAFVDRLKFLNDQYDISLIGGDTFKSPTDLFFSCTIIGEVEKGKALLRSNAAIDEDIYVSGNIGESLLGLKIMKGELEDLSYLDKNYLINRFLYPSARVNLGKEIKKVASSCADISDGLVADLENICSASNVSAEITIKDIPLAYRDEYVTDQITGGEDYELVFTAKKSKAKELAKISKELDVKITKIGQIRKTAKDGEGEVVILNENGHKIELKNKGYTHEI